MVCLSAWASLFQFNLNSRNCLRALAKPKFIIKKSRHFVLHSQWFSTSSMVHFAYILLFLLVAEFCVNSRILYNILDFFYAFSINIWIHFPLWCHVAIFSRYLVFVTSERQRLRCWRAALHLVQFTVFSLNCWNYLWRTCVSYYPQGAEDHRFLKIK